MSVRPIPRLEIRHVERQEDTTHDTIIQSATWLAGQACTNQSKFQSEIRWLQPFARPLTSIGTTSSAYAFREPPPTRESLLRTLPSASSPCSLALLDWGTPFTESESLGLLGLEDFTSGINWSVRRPVIARPVHSLANRRRSTEESDSLGDSNLPKRKRFPILNPASTGGPTIPTPTSASRFHELTTQRGTARIRLGLQKRLGIGPVKSSGAPNHVKMTPKRQLGPGPSRILDSEEEPLDSSVTAFSKPGDTSSVQPSNQAVQPLLPTPKTTSLKSTVLVPSTPSSIARRTTAPPVCGGDSLITSRMAASVSYDSSPDCSSDRISRSHIPTSRPSSDDELSENDSRPQPIPVPRLSNNGLSSVLRSVLVSTEKKVLKEPPGQADDTEEHTGKCLYFLQATQKLIRLIAKDLGQATQLIASVMYDSSQGSTTSHSEETSKLHTTYGTLALPSSFDKDFSSQKTNGSGSWDISDLPPTDSRVLLVPDPILPPSLRIDQTRVVAILEKAREDRG
ncbi:hypothetical protein FRC12_007098 [Ceratobasidium sp. 428]|nr:hypothetical protein FRC12_007098 [Ceratobasidium sp. 428]